MRFVLRLLYRLGMGTASRFRNLIYRGLGVRLEGYVWMRSIEIRRNWADIHLKGCALDRGVTLLCSGLPKPAKIVIGQGTYINRGTMLDSHQKIHIGNNVMVGPHCYITDSDHGMKLGQTIQKQPMKLGEVVIEDEVWIGANVTILKNVHIGKGAVIGAGAVVTRDVGPNEIAAGVPAKTIGIRGR